MSEELEALTHFLEMGEIALEEEENTKGVGLQDKQNNQLRIVKPKGYGNRR